MLGSQDQCPPAGKIETILTNVNISDTEFILEEVIEARKQVKEGKAPGEDSIMPDVLKRINIDDIILKFSNKVLLDGDLPVLFSIPQYSPHCKIE